LDLCAVVHVLQGASLLRATVQEVRITTSGLLARINLFRQFSYIVKQYTSYLAGTDKRDPTAPLIVP
jgi:hypothetical protein